MQLVRAHKNAGLLTTRCQRCGHDSWYSSAHQTTPQGEPQSYAREVRTRRSAEWPVLPLAAEAIELFASFLFLLARVPLSAMGRQHHVHAARSQHSVCV